LFFEMEGMPLSLKAPPLAELDRWQRNSPYFGLEQASTPLLMIYGEFDVGPASVRKVFFELERRGVPVQLVQYSGEGHNPQSRSNVEDAWRRTLAWFET